jgi:hypothetical protein
MDFDTLADSLPHLYGQLRSHAALVERQLADGRDYLLGDVPGWVDVLAYFPVWMSRANVAEVESLLARFEALGAWEQRVAAIGHGQRSEMEAEEALRISRDTEPTTDVQIDADDPLHLQAGAPVAVAPDDYGIVPVAGELVRLTVDDIAVRRVDDRAGEVIVNFPRRGYRVQVG